MLFIRNSKLTKFRKPLFIKEGLGSLRMEAQTLPARGALAPSGRPQALPQRCVRKEY